MRSISTTFMRGKANDSSVRRRLRPAIKGSLHRFRSSGCGRPDGPGSSWDGYYGFMGKKRCREGAGRMPRGSAGLDARNGVSRQFRVTLKKNHEKIYFGHGEIAPQSWYVGPGERFPPKYGSAKRKGRNGQARHTSQNRVFFRKCDHFW